MGTLILPRNARRMDDILEAVDLDGWDPWIELWRPAAHLWRAAGLVLLDVDRIDLLVRMPAHPRLVLLVDAAGEIPAPAGRYPAAGDPSSVVVAHWPSEAGWLRGLVQAAEHSGTAGARR